MRDMKYKNILMQYLKYSSEKFSFIAHVGFPVALSAI